MADISYRQLVISGDTLAWQTAVTVPNGLPSWTVDHTDRVGLCIDGDVLVLFETDNEIYYEGS